MILNAESSIYFCIDRDEDKVVLLLPKRLGDWIKDNGVEIKQLYLSDPDPGVPGAAEYQQLRKEMHALLFDI